MVNSVFLLIFFAIFDPSRLTVCINCSFFYIYGDINDLSFFLPQGHFCHFTWTHSHTNRWVPLPACGFLVFNSNHSSRTPFLTLRHGTDRQTASTLKRSHFDAGGIIKQTFGHFKTGEYCRQSKRWK